MSQIVIISGPPSAGKSTVCDALCERYDRTVHLKTDDVYGWIRMGYIPPWEPGSMRQNLMVSRAVARSATPFAQEQYGVFIDGVIDPPHLPVYLDELRAAGVPVHYAVLLPPRDVIVRRAAARDKQIAGAGDDMFVRVHAMFADATSLPGWAVDNGGMTAEQTADAVMEACGRGDCLVWPPP
jgi:hypothetical protein